jgi:hypothetical protein
MKVTNIFDENTALSVRRTNDYSKFKFIEFNRPLNLRHVAKLKSKIEYKDMQTIITVDYNYGILDGQHRFTAYKELGLPFNYVRLPISSIEDTAAYFMTVNSNSRGLTNSEFIHSLAKVYGTGAKNLPAKYELGHKIYRFYHDVVKQNTDINMTFDNYIAFVDQIVFINNIKRRDDNVTKDVLQRYEILVKVYYLCLPVLTAMKRRKQLSSASMRALAQFNRLYAHEDQTVFDNLLKAYDKYGLHDEFFRKMPTGANRILDRMIDCYNHRKNQDQRIIQV